MRLLPLTLPFALAALGSAQSVTLRFKPPVGKTVQYVSVVSTSSTVPNMATPMAMTQSMPMTYRVVSRSGNATTIQTKTGQVRVTVPPSSPMAGQKAMIEQQSSNMTSTMTIDEMGRIKSMSAQGGAGAAMAQQMGSGMASGAQSITYPTGPVKAGDSWSSSLDLGKMMGGMAAMGMKATGKIPITYRLVSVSKGTVTISMTMAGATTMTMNAPGAPGGKPMSMVLTMNSKGTMTVDPATGLLQSMTSTTDTNTAVMGMNMKQHMTMSMKAK